MTDDRDIARNDESAAAAGEDGELEPPPLGTTLGNGIYSDPVPFGSPPAEAVTVEGEVPWELAEAVPFGDERDERDARESGNSGPVDPDASTAQLS